MLHVHVVELNRTTMRELGLEVKEPRAHMLFHVEEGQAFLAGLRQLQQKDLVRILAEPILVTMSGRPACFNAGGEIPVPAVGDAPFRYVPYGTQVQCTAFVLDEGTIRVRIKPRVSELDRNREIEVKGVKIPSMIVREIDTEVEAKSGQTVVLSGAVRKTVEKLADGSERIREIELLFLVKPELVAPDVMVRTPMLSIPAGPNRGG
jgi:pilus assembly protein CpaC